MKKFLSFLIIFTFIATAFILSSCKTSVKSDNELHSVSSAEEIAKLIKEFNSRYNVSSNDKGRDSNDLAQAESGGDYSKTNTQVDGIDEGDIVKVDGNSIYKLNQNGFLIVDAESMTITSQIKKENYLPQELYVYGNKLVIIGGIYEQFSYNGSRAIEAGMDCMSWYSYSKTEIAVYDLTDKSNPVLQRSVILDGNYYTSRLIEGKLYYMINYHFYYGNENDYIPDITDSANGSIEKKMNLSDIYYFNNIPNYGYLILGLLDLNNTDSLTQKAYLGLYGEIYVSENNIYVATADYSALYVKNFLGELSYDSTKKPSTRIVKISLSDIAYKNMGFVEGTIKDRYSLDEYNGYLRVATTTSWCGENWSDRYSYSGVYVLDSDLKNHGELKNLAEGESIYSVRFKKDTCSLVTFRQVDPLFFINLSNPSKPTLTGELKEEGVSYYLHYVEGTDYIIGLGRDTELLSNDRVIWKGLKVSLYKKDSSGNPVNLDTKYIGNAWSYAEALYNPKAILVEDEKNIFAFACEQWDAVNYNDYSSYKLTNQALFIFSIDFENEELIENTVSNFENGLNYGYNSYDSWYNWYDNYHSYITRGVRIGNYLYTISEKYITKYSMTDYFKISSLQIAEFKSAKELFGNSEKA